jgi:hypothetical protein
MYMGSAAGCQPHPLENPCCRSTSTPRLTTVVLNYGQTKKAITRAPDDEESLKFPCSFEPRRKLGITTCMVSASTEMGHTRGKRRTLRATLVCSIWSHGLCETWDSSGALPFLVYYRYREEVVFHQCQRRNETPSSCTGLGGFWTSGTAIYAWKSINTSHLMFQLHPSLLLAAAYILLRV